MKTAAIFLVAAAALGCSRGRAPEGAALRLGLVNSPLAASAYVAEEQARAEGAAPPFELRAFGSSGDVGLALLAGEIDAGWIESEKAVQLLRNDGLLALGGVEYAYGATLVVRKGLDLRLDDLPGRTVAVRSGGCRLFHQFAGDLERLGVGTNGVRFVQLPFEDMGPALEARKVDAILTRGATALLSVALGHEVLYQNWEVSGSDLCCPDVAAQIEWVLVARAAVRPSARRALVAALEAGAAVSPAEARAAVARRTRIPLGSLEDFPVAVFAAFDDDLRKAYGDRLVGKEKHADDCGHGDCGHDH